MTIVRTFGKMDTTLLWMVSLKVLSVSLCTQDPAHQHMEVLVVGPLGDRSVLPHPRLSCVTCLAQ